MYRYIHKGTADAPFDSSYSSSIAVIAYKTRSTSKPAYLSDLLQDYRPARTLRSSDKLLVSVPRMALAISAKAFSVSGAPLQFGTRCHYQCRSAELFGSFRRILKTELFDIAYSERKQSAQCPPVCASDSLATHCAIQICFD